MFVTKLIFTIDKPNCVRQLITVSILPPSFSLLSIQQITRIEKFTSTIFKNTAQNMANALPVTLKNLKRLKNLRFAGKHLPFHQILKKMTGAFENWRPISLFIMDIQYFKKSFICVLTLCKLPHQAATCVHQRQISSHKEVLNSDWKLQGPRKNSREQTTGFHMGFR